MSADSGHRPDPCRHTLADILQRNIIPRLLQAHPVPAGPSRTPPPAIHRPPAADQAALLSHCLQGNTQMASNLLRSLHQAGMTHDELGEYAIAPAARELGRRWDADLLSSAEVAVALSVLKLLALALRETAEPESSIPTLHALVSPVPGSQHTLGAAVLAGVLERAGWEVDGPCLSREDLLQRVHDKGFDLIGLSLAREADREGLADLVADLRRESAQQPTRVVLGGPLWCHGEQAGDRAADYGADCICLAVHQLRDCSPQERAACPHQSGVQPPDRS